MRELFEALFYGFVKSRPIFIIDTLNPCRSPDVEGGEAADPPSVRLSSIQMTKGTAFQRHIVSVLLTM
jgi:hypothetical protein